MEINERINNIVTAYRNLNGSIRKSNEPMQSELKGIWLNMNGQLVEAVNIGFNDLNCNNNLSITINHPYINNFPVCLKLHINDETGTVEWHSLRYKIGAEDALGNGITPEEVLDCIQEAVTIALSNFVRDICEDMRKMTKFSEEV